MSNPMEQQDDEPDLSLKEWALKARLTRENTTSRRFSASNLKSFREAAAISSTASSPGYTLKDEIDPSTYSFTTALKALQAKTVYTWEYQSPEGLTLNSKWNDAEKYICNPLSGEVPFECLSAKTLSGRSFRTRITMSAPLIYPPNVDITSKEKKRGPTRDVGTQSTPLEMSSSSPSPASTPSIVERSPVKVECGDDSSSAVSSGKLKSESTEQQQVEEVRETRERERNGGERKKQTMCRCSNSQGGCLSLSFKGLWRRQHTHIKINKHATYLS